MNGERRTVRQGTVWYGVVSVCKCVCNVRSFPLIHIIHSSEIHVNTNIQQKTVQPGGTRVPKNKKLYLLIKKSESESESERESALRSRTTCACACACECV